VRRRSVVVVVVGRRVILASSVDDVGRRGVPFSVRDAPSSSVDGFGRPRSRSRQ
jgi:hypothetical protein